MFARLRAFASRLSAWLFVARSDREFDAELESHLAMLEEDALRRGLSAEAARRDARLRLGGVVQLQEANREARGLPALETFLQDARYALRMFRGNPGFTAVTVLTLALGVGANSAIFSVVHAVLLKPLPYAEPELLLNVFQQKSREEAAKTGWSYPNFDEFRRQATSFSGLAGAQSHQTTLTGRAEPLVVNTAVVTPEFFSVFGVSPLRGRGFVSEDGQPGSPPVAMLSEALWRRWFGADAGIVGTAIVLDQRSFTVVGIMPAAFRFPVVAEAEKVWIPLVHDPLFGGWLERRGGHWLQVTGRVKPGVTPAALQAELDSIGVRLAAAAPADNDGWLIRTISLQRMIVGNVRSALFLLLGAVGLVLAIACANIASLLLARATARTREIALRAALGAGRGRIARQLLSESAVLGLAGGVVGAAIAYAGVAALRAWLPPGLPEVNPIRVDRFVLGFALLLSLLASLLFGLAPALLVAHQDLRAALHAGGRGGEGTRARRSRSLLAVVEIALAMVLLVGSGLLLRSFSRLTAVRPGFETERLVKAEISLPRFQYQTPQQWRTFADALLPRVQAEPGLQESAVVIPAPIADGSVNLAVEIVGSPPLSAASAHTANYVAASPAYLRVMGIPVMAGRFFDERDGPTSARVCAVSQAFARTYFAGLDPIGKQLSFAFPPDAGVAREIVGIVGDVRDVGLGREPGPMMYVPFAQAPFPGVVLVVRGPLPAADVAAGLRRAAAGLDKDLPVSAVAAMPEVLRGSVAEPRFRTFLLALFAAMALALAATGIFGVISYSVSRRTQEIGIRMALGAARATIVELVMREALLLTAAGLALGIPSAIAGARLIGHMLFGVSPADPVTLAAVVAGLVAVAALAGYVPVRRALRVDPMVALRHD